MPETIVIMRSLHILFAILWAGGGLHFELVSKRSFEEQGNLLQFLANSKHGPFMGAAALGTVGFGLITWLMAGGEAYSTVGNSILGTGALGAIVGLLVGFLGHLPNSVRAKAALENNDQEAMERIAARAQTLDKLSFVGIGVALVAMITFRWF